MKTRRISLQLPRILLVALLFLFLCSCESNDAQIAALASSQAQLATQIALLATAQPQQATLIADQATRVASSLQIAQLSSTQAQQATQIAGQVTVVSNVDQIARLSTLQAQLATLQAQQATQMAGQATRLANTNEIDQLSSAQAQQATEIANHVSWISHLSTRIPPRELPGNLTPASPTAYRPVDGSATIEDGRCCAGGVAGETIEVTINLGAFSPMAAAVGKLLGDFDSGEKTGDIELNTGVDRKLGVLTDVALHL